jgi:hypothetical protein
MLKALQNTSQITPCHVNGYSHFATQTTMSIVTSYD